jgi:hypothetical protein
VEFSSRYKFCDAFYIIQVFGFLAGFAALLMAIFGTYELCRLHLPPREDTDQLTLTERASREMQRMQEQQSSSSSKRPQVLHSPPGIMEPPVTATVWPIDDVQPCSSKHITSPPTNCNNTGGHHHGHSQSVDGTSSGRSQQGHSIR